MPSYLDLAVLAIVLVSALLSMLRGFSREVLAIASWAAAAAAAYYLYPVVTPYLTPYIHKDVIAQAAAAAIVFFATLIVVSLFTVRLSDAILDSKIGALDRTLGFVFGVARGFLLAVVAFAIFNWLVSDKQQPEWVKTAKTRPILTDTADKIVALLPEDAAATIDAWIKSRGAVTPANEEPIDEFERPDRGQTDDAAPGRPAERTEEGGRALGGRVGQAEARRADQRAPASNGPEAVTAGDAASAGVDLDADRLHEECGVFGIFGHPDAAAIVALGLHALQHRGQEAAGIVAFDGERFHSERRQGLVGDHFSSGATIDRLPGRAAIGHVRYSTTGETALRNVQPLFAELEAGGLAVAHNGNLTNGLTLRRELIRGGAICQSTTDTEVVLLLAARSRRPRILDRFVEALAEIEGAYALVALTNKKLIGARDPLGIRPLVLGELDGCPILCSETCALDIIGARFIRDVENGEVVVIDADGVKSFFPLPRQPARPCIFEYVYFARPDSIVHGRSVYDARKAMGEELAREAPAAADVVVPVPDSGVPAAIGYARGCGLPFELGIIRNHYVGRTFIQPTQSIRELGVRMKHNANRTVVAGKRVVLIDDFDRARNDERQDRPDDARCRRARGAFPHLLAADRLSRFLWHRHAGARQTARRPHGSREHARIHRGRQSGLPVGGGHLSRHGLFRAQRQTAAIHRPLLYRRLSDPAHRQGWRAGGPASAASGGSGLKGASGVFEPSSSFIRDLAAPSARPRSGSQSFQGLVAKTDKRRPARWRGPLISAGAAHTLLVEPPRSPPVRPRPRSRAFTVLSYRPAIEGQDKVPRSRPR